MSRGSTVDIAIGYGLYNEAVGVWFLVGSRIVTSPYCPDRLCGPPIQWVLGALYLAVKWPVHKAAHSPPTTAEDNRTWIYTSSLHSAWLVKHKDNFTFNILHANISTLFSSLVFSKNPEEGQMPWLTLSCQHS
jgi:hypothetical protein